jgi:hypothetical protein
MSHGGVKEVMRFEPSPKVMFRPNCLLDLCGMNSDVLAKYHVVFS